MPVRSPTLPFSIGTDITSISRFSHYFNDVSGVNNMQTNKLLRFFDKIFTAPEQQLFWHRYQGLEGLQGNSRARVDATQYLAGRWATKEAIIKAWKTRRLLMQDIEIYARERQAPLAIVLDERRSRPFDTMEKKPEERQARRLLREWTELNILKEVRHVDSSKGGHKTSRIGHLCKPPQSELASHEEKGPDEVDFDRTMPIPEDTDGEEVAISISHDGDFCIAMAIVPLAHESAIGH